MLKISKIYPIGIGTYGIGGFAERNPDNNDTKQIAALSHMFNKGMNYLEVNMWSAQGHSTRLASEALRDSGKKRDSIFISQAVYNFKVPTLDDAYREIEQSMKLFKTDYIDSFEFNNTAFKVYGLEATIEMMHNLLKDGTTRYVAIANPSLENLKRLQQEFGEKLFSIEAGFNFEIRENVDLGIIPYALENGKKVVVFQPLRRNRTALRNWPLLVELSEKYGKTQNQIILNWIVSKGFLPIFKSDNIEHIDENLAALDFEITTEDIKRLDEFRPPSYISPVIKFNEDEDGVRIDQLSNVFDEEYEKQTKSLT